MPRLYPVGGFCNWKFADVFPNVLCPNCVPNSEVLDGWVPICVPKDNVLPKPEKKSYLII